MHKKVLATSRPPSTPYPATECFHIAISGAHETQASKFGPEFVGKLKTEYLLPLQKVIKFPCMQLPEQHSTGVVVSSENHPLINFAREHTETVTASPQNLEMLSTLDRLGYISFRYVPTIFHAIIPMQTQKFDISDVEQFLTTIDTHRNRAVVTIKFKDESFVPSDIKDRRFTKIDNTTLKAEVPPNDAENKILAMQHDAYFRENLTTPKHKKGVFVVISSTTNFLSQKEKSAFTLLQKFSISEGSQKEIRPVAIEIKEGFVCPTEDQGGIYFLPVTYFRYIAGSKQQKDIDLIKEAKKMFTDIDGTQLAELLPLQLSVKQFGTAYDPYDAFTPNAFITVPVFAPSDPNPDNQAQGFPLPMVLMDLLMPYTPGDPEHGKTAPLEYMEEINKFLDLFTTDPGAALASVLGTNPFKDVLNIPQDVFDFTKECVHPKKAIALESSRKASTAEGDKQEVVDLKLNDLIMLASVCNKKAQHKINAANLGAFANTFIPMAREMEATLGIKSFDKRMIALAFLLLQLFLGDDVFDESKFGGTINPYSCVSREAKRLANSIYNALTGETRRNRSDSRDIDKAFSKDVLRLMLIDLIDQGNQDLLLREMLFYLANEDKTERKPEAEVDITGGLSSPRTPSGTLASDRLGILVSLLTNKEWGSDAEDEGCTEAKISKGLQLYQAELIKGTCIVDEQKETDPEKERKNKILKGTVRFNCKNIDKDLKVLKSPLILDGETTNVNLKQLFDKTLKTLSVVRATTVNLHRIFRLIINSKDIFDTDTPDTDQLFFKEEHEYLDVVVGKEVPQREADMIRKGKTQLAPASFDNIRKFTGAVRVVLLFMFKMFNMNVPEKLWELYLATIEPYLNNPTCKDNDAVSLEKEWEDFYNALLLEYAESDQRSRSDVNPILDGAGTFLRKRNQEVREIPKEANQFLNKAEDAISRGELDTYIKEVLTIDNDTDVTPEQRNKAKSQIMNLCKDMVRLGLFVPRANLDWAAGGLTRRYHKADQRFEILEMFNTEVLNEISQRIPKKVSEK